MARLPGDSMITVSATYLRQTKISSRSQQVTFIILLWRHRFSLAMWTTMVSLTTSISARLLQRLLLGKQHFIQRIRRGNIGRQIATRTVSLITSTTASLSICSQERKPLLDVCQTWWSPLRLEETSIIFFYFFLMYYIWMSYKEDRSNSIHILTILHIIFIY